jgi:hypothetical protein
MTMITAEHANTRLDQLMAEPDFAHHIVALRSLIADGMSVAETDFMLRGMFPTALIAVLVEAHAARTPEPIIAA